MKLIQVFTVGAASLLMIACTTNPLTGRQSVQLVSDAEIASMAVQQYQEVLSKSKVVKGTTAANQVKNVGLRLQNAAKNYYNSIGRSQDLTSFNWEYNLIQDASANAWCMPGGKVAVYSGILPITQNETGLAVVLGHEISHALAGHGNERISQAMIAQYGGQILGGTISNGQLGQVLGSIYSVGGQVALLKYGRKQELEADEMGLYLMSMAGYDPRGATPFWNRMESMTTSGNRPPEFLSTHPSPENRKSQIAAHLPKALEYYKNAGGKI
ncbi:M48 family metallopeptidase [Chryseobacterium sp. A301]